MGKEPTNEEAQKQYSMVNSLKERIEEIKDYINWGSFEAAIESLNEVLEFIPWDASLRELRAEAYLGLGNVIHAISDIRTVTKLTSDNTAAFFKLANLHYQIGEADESLAEIRECLKLYPEHKDCYPLYKKLKKVAKFLNAAKESRERQEWEECVSNAQKVLKNEPQVEGIRFHAHDRLCHCQKEAGNSAESRKACGEALKIEDEPRLYCDRQRLTCLMICLMRPSKTLELPWRRMKASRGLRRAWLRLRNCRSRRGKEIITRSLVSREAPPRSRSQRLIRSWPWSGILTSSRMRRRRRWRRKSSWTSRQPRKSSRIQICEQNMTRERIPLTPRTARASILSDREASTSPGATPSVVDPSSSSFISSDLTAFTQISFITITCYPYFYIKRIYSR